MTRRDRIFDKIIEERNRQERIHGEKSIIRRNPLAAENALILGEEYGEVCEALFITRETGDLDLGFEAYKNLKEELVQVAAVCVAWLEALEEKN